MPVGKRLVGCQMSMTSCRPPWAKRLPDVREALGSIPSPLQWCWVVAFHHMGGETVDSPVQGHPRLPCLYCSNAKMRATLRTEYLFLKTDAMLLFLFILFMEDLGKKFFFSFWD